MRLPSLILSAALIVSCNQEQEAPPVAAAAMEAVILDLELAHAYAAMPGPVASDSLAGIYEMAVFKKHGLSKQEYEAALKWYYQHPALLDSVYTHVKNDLEQRNSKQ